MGSNVVWPFAPGEAGASGHFCCSHNKATQTLGVALVASHAMGFTVRLLLSDPGGGGGVSLGLGQVSATHPPTNPPTHPTLPPPGGGGGSMPSTRSHVICGTTEQN